MPPGATFETPIDPANTIPVLPEKALWPETPEGGLVLVVEDEAVNRFLLTHQLEQQGHTVTAVPDGETALGLLREGVFDLVLLDMVLPGIDGPEVLTRLKHDTHLWHLPVIMVSSNDEIETSIRCIELGAEDFLPKPCDPRLLQARIGASLEKKRLRDREIRLHEHLETNYRRLQDLEKMRDDLTHMIVHDLRTPLTSLLTGLQTIPLMGALSTDQTEFLNMAVGGGQTLLGMINDLLDVGKLEDGSLTLELQDQNADTAIQAAIGQLAHLARSKSLTIHTEIDAGLPRVRADEEKLRRILVNLAGNALKFTPFGGTITISARTGEGQDSAFAIFAVRDTGEGIPESAFTHIFEKFGQVEDRKGGRKNSTGLGLTFCKMAVEAHGGRIWVESTLAEGSTFSFTIPFA